jgi:hypothetical protein
MGDYAFRPTIFPVNGFSSIPRYPTHPQLTDNRMLKQEREIFAVKLVILSNTVVLSSSTCLPAQVHKSRNWSPLSAILQSDNEAATRATPFCEQSRCMLTLFVKTFQFDGARFENRIYKLHDH